MIDLLNSGEKVISKLQELEEKFAINPSRAIGLEAVQLLAPIPRPSKNIFCVGVNYREHFSEVEDVLDNPNIPKFPVIFSKAPTTVIGPNTKVKRHADIISQLDYEVELAVIIGKKGTKIKKEVAYDYIFGYTILNDISARDLQFRHGQWFLGKSCDTFAPMGPWIVHKSALSNPQELDIQCRINGELRQSNNTKNMIFDIPTIIETISSVITLEPGDIIATGTPSGVGLGFNPPKYLQAGDIMELWIEKIGVLTNIIEGI
jgi:2-keto-4-pentenoate hydratase/2-oxohepta-3-ene-1,7-dioic acid hydratase in catechol pathway